MDETLGVEVPDGAALEATVTWRQLREICRPLGAGYRIAPERARGEEARGEPWHRTQVKPCKAGPTWVSMPVNAKPDIQSRRDGNGDGGRGTWFVLTSGGLGRSAPSGRRRGGDDALPMPGKESDHPIVVVKPGNAGGAKGVTD